ncbi:alkaline phosphatase family protein [Haloferax profundi]|uniref:alkaline phosphatase family protein n=1 Tax=Haloferax profundi TaxID=1544718 RepID=UPI0009EB0602|nr:alkaline phosphatase family protein [Haloferax profundi]
MSRLVVMGLDGFHEDLLEYTPFIKQLYESNPSCELESTKPPVTAPAWASFQTGKQQGKHGVYDFVNYDDDREMSFVDGTQLRAKTFYEYLDDGGYDCFLYNLPYTRPSRIDGDIVPSWLSDNIEPTPEGLYSRYDIEPPLYPQNDGTELENVREMRKTLQHNAEQFQTVLKEDDHDFLFQLISETDWLQHFGYRELQLNPNSAVSEASIKLLRDVDEYVERVQGALSEDDILLLMSDHGFNLYEGVFYINDWLKKKGYLETGSSTVDDKDQSQNTLSTGSIGRVLLQQQWLHPILRPMKNLIRSAFDIEFSFEEGIDFESSNAWCLSKDEASIRLNKQLTADESARVVDEICKQIASETAVNAYRADEIYEGEFSEEAGEIVLESVTHKAYRGPTGAVKLNTPIAHHDSAGIFAAIGDVPSNQLSPANLIDVAPTLLGLLDSPIPDDFDGEPIQQLLKKDIDYIKAPDNYTLNQTKTEGDMGGVEDRLENLGYL